MPLQYSPEQIEQKLRTYIAKNSTANEQKLLEYAFDDIKKYHDNYRKDGSPYYLHPLRIALKISEYGLEAKVVVASLLHDLIEDTIVDERQILNRYGEWYAKVVLALSKVENGQSWENYFRLLYGSLVDCPSIFFIKLFDRWDNLRDMKLIHQKKRLRVGRESLHGYLPLLNN